MKKITLFLLLFASAFLQAQSLPIDFEGAVVTADFTDFDGGTATVISNPESSGINTSATVAQIVREGGQPWAGSKIELDANLDFTSSSLISMKVFSTAPVGTVVKMKLEGDGETERDVLTSLSGEWETLTWDFTGEPANFNDLVFMFDFGNVGDGSATSTFLFDDVEQLFGGEQIDLPVNFEGDIVNYTVTDFGGTSSSLVADPTNSDNHVIEVIKTAAAETWAGTTIGTPAGFATNIPLTLTNSRMFVRVWSPTAGTPVRLKVEDSSDPTHTCETQTNTTLAGEWEFIEFDFANEAPGTAALSFGLDNGWTYNMASIFFNFDTDGATAGEQIYYFDNVSFGEIYTSIKENTLTGIEIYPNPTAGQWIISSSEDIIETLAVYDLQGKLIFSSTPQAAVVNINATNFAKGMYIARLSTANGTGNIRLLKE